MFSAYNNGTPNSKGEYPKGAYPIGHYKIKDDHEFKKNILSIQDIIVYSSNIGTLQVAQKMNAKEFIDGLKSFGITQPTGIDLPYEKTGKLPSYAEMSAGEKYGRDNIYKATVSYGQGMTATFMQLIKAYSTFNNDGIMVTPKLVNKLRKEDGEDINITTPANNKRIISSEVANYMKSLLIKTVEEGTGSSTKIEGLEIGGKTGTAQVAGLGGYKKEYISSFIGFVNDYSGNKYIIGVTVWNPRGTQWYHYYASQSAVPVFKEIVDTLTRLNYLKPKNYKKGI
jgi:cell division protein FtsI (penicillin-binding protein 3)